jgi:hypothetical protein
MCGGNGWQGDSERTEMNTSGDVESVTPRDFWTFATGR